MEEKSWKELTKPQVNLAKEIYQLDKTKLLTMEEIDLLSWLNQELVDEERELFIGLITKFYNYKGE